MARGQIIPRGDRKWMLRVYLGRDANGKRMILNETFEGTHAQAQKAMTKLQAAKDTRSLATPNTWLVKPFFEKWLSGKTDITDRSRAQYERMAKHAWPFLGNLKLSAVQPLHLQAMVSKLSGSPNTIRHIIQPLNNCFETAVRWGLLIRNPFEHVTLPRLIKSERLTLSPAQSRSIIEDQHPDMLHNLWVTLLGTGMRPGEATALKWEDLTLDGEAWVSIHRVNRDQVIVEDTKTTRSKRRISLPQFVVEALQAQRREQMKWRMYYGPNYEDQFLVFSTKWGKPLDLHEVYLRWKRLLKRLDLPEMPMYRTRHTHATELLSAGVSLRAVADRLGHSNVQMTASVYAHVTPELNQEVSVAVDRVFGRRLAQ